MVRVASFRVDRGARLVGAGGIGRRIEAKCVAKSNSPSRIECGAIIF